MAFALPIANYGQSPIGNQSSALQLIMQLVGQASSAQDEARNANETRYNDILDQLAQGRSRALDDLSNLSGQQVADANQSYDNMRNELLTDLADRGLGGSTKRIAVESKTKRERDAAVNRIQDTLRRERSTADERFLDRTTGVMERRSDPYPDTSNVAALVAQLAPLLNRQMSAPAPVQAPMPVINPAFANDGQPQYFAPPQPAPRRTAAPRVKPQTMAERIAEINAQRAAENPGYDEQRRRNAMIQLTNTMRPGWQNINQEQQALAYLVSNGWAEQNPAATSNVLVDQSGRYGQPVYQSPSYGIPAYPGRTPLWQRDPTFLSVLNQQGLHPEPKAQPSNPISTLFGKLFSSLGLSQQGGAANGKLAQQQRIDAIKRDRTKFVGSQGNLDSIARMHARGLGMRPNPGAAPPLIPPEYSRSPIKALQLGSGNRCRSSSNISLCRCRFISESPIQARGPSGFSHFSWYKEKG